MADLIRTIQDDEEEQEEQTTTTRKNFNKDEEDSDEDKNITFEWTESTPHAWNFQEVRKKLTKDNFKRTTVDQKIQSVLMKKATVESEDENDVEEAKTELDEDDTHQEADGSKDETEDDDEDNDALEDTVLLKTKAEHDNDNKNENEEEEEEKEEEDEEDEEDEDEEDEDEEDNEVDQKEEEKALQKQKENMKSTKNKKSPVDVDAEEEEDEEDEDIITSTREIKGLKYKPQKDSFFSKAPSVDISHINSFEDLHLSRALLKAISDLGWISPSPIQKQVIPVALSGRDLAASAVTGSGKTASFVLPILERLLYRDTRVSTVRVLILTPTRELAAQCQSVIVNLAKYTNNIRCALVLGGLPLNQQTVELRSNPDIIVATPGRILDHLLNTLSFGLESLEILVLDEADRLLELGFQDDIKQIVRMCPKGRQSMLFSATMTEKVSDLVLLSLHHPVRISADPLMHTSRKLMQEFVKIKKINEEDREAVLLALCKNTFKTAVLIFFRQKLVAHKMKIIFGMAGLNAAELHGNLTQAQRLDALEQFRDGKVDYLLATDLASRGLDIVGMKTVINFTMPGSEAVYIHRVGRTARAGKDGLAVSLVGDSSYDRNLLKSIVKHSHPGSCKHRIVAVDSIKKWKEKIEKMGADIEKVLMMEAEERAARLAEKEVKRVENIIIHKDEIESRPPKTWHVSQEQRLKTKEQARQAVEDAQKKLKGKGGDEDEENKEDGGGGGGEEKIYQPARIPSIKKELNRRDRKLKDATTIDKSKYNLAKKKNKAKDSLKRQRSKQEGGLPNAKKAKKTVTSTNNKKRGKSLSEGSVTSNMKSAYNKPQRAGSFKSKKKHKRH